MRALVAILGPTASGKSDLAIFLAEQFSGEVVNCDSVQIYRHFNIGTAKVPENERRGIPHHMMDIAEPADVFTAGEYARGARAVLDGIASRGHLPIVTGGTGFYLRALLEGLFPAPERDIELRERLLGRERRRTGSLHRLLIRLDPASASRIHPNDVNKTLRALEICLLARAPVSQLFQTGRDALTGFRAIKAGLNPGRDQLYRRIDRRVVVMFERGLINEVRELLESGVSEHAKPFESLGYKEALAVVRGEMTVEQAITGAQMHTRRYAKRQMTWFRRERDVAWFNGFGDCPEVQRAVSDFVQNSLRVSQNEQ